MKVIFIPDNAAIRIEIAGQLLMKGSLKDLVK